MTSTMKPSRPPNRRPGSRGHTDRTGARGRSDDAGAGDVWLWGTHAVLAGLANPQRTTHEVLATRNAARDLPGGLVERGGARVVEPAVIDDVLPRGAVHQGVAARCAPLAPVALDTLLAPADGLLVLVDQVTDPQNMGAMLRSAAAFGARGVILQDRKAPPFSGGCAKAAVGAAERVPHARVVNLSRALEAAREAGWRTIGLAGEAEMDIDAALAEAVAQTAGDGRAGAIVLALGGEEKGLRPSVRAACDVLGRIAISDAVESLNVSNAAAIALHAAARARAVGAGARASQGAER